MDLFTQARRDDLVRTARRTPRRLQELRHDVRHCACGALASLVNPRRVDPQRCRSAAAVTEPPCDRADVDTGRDELSGRVVPQRVQPCAAQLELLRQVAITLCQRSGRPGCRAVRRRREQERRRFELAPERCASFFRTFTVRLEHLNSLRIESYPTLLPRLGLFLLDASPRLGVAAFDPQQSTPQVEVLPPERAHLATA